MVKKGTNDGVETIWTVGAGIGVVGIAITQRIQLLNETCWSQSENKIIFKTDDRPEYLKTRNLDHYIDKREFFLDTDNKYWFYYTTGNGNGEYENPYPPQPPPTPSANQQQPKQERVILNQSVASKQ